MTQATDVDADQHRSSDNARCKNRRGRAGPADIGRCLSLGGRQATALVGQGLGAGTPDLAKRSAGEALQLGLAVMGTTTPVFLAVPQHTMMIYTSDPEIIGLGSMAFRVVSFGQVPMGTAFTYPGALRGAGDTRSVLYVTAFAVWVVRLNATYLPVAAGGLGLLGARLAMVTYRPVRGGYVWHRFRACRWKELQV